MLTRIISGVIGVIALVAVLVFMPPIATEIAVVIVSAIALFEFYRALFGGKTGMMSKILIVIVGYIFGLVLAFANPEQMFPAVVIGALVVLAVPVFRYEIISFKDASAAYLGSVYIFGLLRHITMVRELSGGNLLVFAIFIGAFITDTGAYFVGCFFGKHKLAPQLSPKKTIEGSVGGVVATVLAFCLYGYVGRLTFDYSVNIVNLAITAVLLALVSQVGDLAASAIKREIGIKDYGNLMPGHGGALDRFDSVLFTAPVFYYLNNILPIFGN